MATAQVNVQVSVRRPIETWKPTDAVSVYRSLREANPHLPDPDIIAEFTLDPGDSLTLPRAIITTYVTLPESWQAPDVAEPTVA